DGVITSDEWGPDSFFDVVIIDSCLYGLNITWDADFLWIGLNSDTCRYFLGDDPDNISLFVAIDTDQTFGSGAPTDGYGNVNFYGCRMPEYIFYFAGGAGWYEWNYWTGTEFEWRGWRNDNTFYAWDGGGVYDDELGILWSDLGFPTGVGVMAWITFDQTFNGDPPGVLASWPIENPIGILPIFTWAYPFFFPHVPGPMPVAGFLPNALCGDNGEFSATQPSTWGAVKALYK
ncbi:unnamed protein product, partial [marine sediment metagenome]